MNDLAERKARLRASAKAVRAAAHAAAGPQAPIKAGIHFLENIAIGEAPGPAGGGPAASGAATGGAAGGEAPIVAGYWPVGAEFDARPLLSELARAGATVALPVAVGAGKPLLFRKWSFPTDATGAVPEPPARDIHAIPIPGAEAPAVTPEIILVPLLAFDRGGWRLGSGLGYYDITLAGLRRRGWTGVAVGFAFAAQEVREVPRGADDQPLDWIVTEREAIETGARDAT
jgi:5-formyltetrahydrofolate cyclo-ligase